jgi:hypothetical protein
VCSASLEQSTNLALLEVVGQSLWGTARTGWCLYSCTLRPAASAIPAMTGSPPPEPLSLPAPRACAPWA